MSNVLFVPRGQTFLTHGRGGGDKHFSHTGGSGGDKHFSHTGGGDKYFLFEAGGVMMMLMKS